MHWARKVHPLLTRRRYAHVVVDCVREHGSPDKLRGAIDKWQATRCRVPHVVGTSSSEIEIQHPQGRN
jgi:hypothetical protein